VRRSVNLDPIKVTYTIDIGDIKDPPEWNFYRRVKYWKGQRYVFFIKKKSVFAQCVERLSDEILNAINDEIIKAINSENTPPTTTSIQKATSYKEIVEDMRKLYPGIDSNPTSSYLEGSQILLPDVLSNPIGERHRGLQSYAGIRGSNIYNPSCV
jgi:hypothetical protein